MNSHRPSSPAMESEIDLAMECLSSPLSETQMTVKTQAEEEYKRFMKTFNESLVKRNAEIIEKGTHITVYEIDCTPS